MDYLDGKAWLCQIPSDFLCLVLKAKRGRTWRIVTTKPLSCGSVSSPGLLGALLHAQYTTPVLVVLVILADDLSVSQI